MYKIRLLSILLSQAILMLTLSSCQKPAGKYVCKPCDRSCDQLFFDEPGICPHCKMDLLKKSELELTINEINIQTGSGVFLIEGAKGNLENAIRIYYHKPNNYQADSRVLFVIPGAGRNGDSYRDAWIEESEKYGVLILSPMYPEETYEFEDYHLGGLAQELNLANSISYVENSNIAKLDESQFSLSLNEDSETWLFNDFDRIFDLSMRAMNASQTTYDLFGHSAGGQILHRMAIFQTASKADRILAANSGFYTLTDTSFTFPFGTKNMHQDKQFLASAFQKKLVLFLGELDNADETGGTLLRSESVDKQGLHRLARGKFFFNHAKDIALQGDLTFNWELKIIPQVGHNHREMGDAAGKFLYETL